MFELHYEPLIISENLNSWEIAVIPWDTETFGFGVSVLKPQYDAEGHGKEATALEEALKKHSENRQARTIITSIPAEQTRTSLLLQKAGFYMIDMALSVRYENLHSLLQNKPQKLSLVPAVPSEMGILAEMAGVSFRHGRYHLDPCIPRSLADLRYKDWLNRCLVSNNPQQVLTAKMDDAICGFSVVEHRDWEGYLHLHAIDSKWQGQKLGREMIVQSLRYLYNLGAKRVDTKISSSNLGAVNMHSRLNGKFIETERLLHWHRSEKQ